MLDALIDPWTYGAWMWRGTLAAILAAVPCAMLGVFLYLRRLSLIADALTHVALPGIVAAFLLSGSIDPFPMLIGAGGVGLLSAMAIEGLSRRTSVRSDAAIGIVFTALFSVGVIALSIFVQDAHIDTQCVLFGDVLGISDDSLLLLSIVAPGVIAAVLFFYRWLAVASFDPQMAASLGVPVAAVHYGLMGAVSVTTVASFEAIGAILAIAFIVVPAAFAHIFCDRLHTMLLTAVAHSISSAVIGMYVAVYFDVSAAGAIVCVGGSLYALAFLFAPRHGAATRLLAPSNTRARQRPHVSS